MFPLNPSAMSALPDVPFEQSLKHINWHLRRLVGLDGTHGRVYPGICGKEGKKDPLHGNETANKHAMKECPDMVESHKYMRALNKYLRFPRSGTMKKQMKKKGLCYTSAPEPRYMSHMYNVIKVLMEFYSETAELLRSGSYKKVRGFRSCQFVIELAVQCE
eukprot:324527_1